MSKVFSPYRNCRASTRRITVSLCRRWRSNGRKYGLERRQNSVKNGRSMFESDCRNREKGRQGDKYDQHHGDLTELGLEEGRLGCRRCEVVEESHLHLIEVIEGAEERRNIGITSVRIALKARGDDGSELRREVRSDVIEARNPRVKVQHQNLGGICPGKGRRSGEQFVEQHPQRVQINTVIATLLFDLLGSHVVGGSGSLPSAGIRWRERQPKIDQDRLILVNQEDVFRFEVPVNLSLIHI